VELQLDRSEEIRVACAIAGHDVQLHCDPRLRPWLSPLTAFPALGGPVALAIDVSAATVEPGRAPTRMHGSPDGRLLHIDQPGARIVFDRLARQLSAAVALDLLPRWEHTKPLSLPLTVWLSDLGLLAVHAGAVARDGRALLFAGPSGSGKSTCSLACARAGFDFLADDFVVCDPLDGFRSHAVYASAALDAGGLARLDAGVPAATGDKVLVTAGQSAMPRVMPSALPAALVLPRIAGANRTTLRRASAADALARLAPRSILRRAVPAAHSLRALAALVAAMPAYWLDLSADPREVPETAAALLETLS
jgi:hypothetical protein